MKPAAPKKADFKPSAMTSVARQQLIVVNGMLDEVTRNYVARLRREIGQVLHVLDAVEKNGDVVPRQRRDLRKMLELMARLQLNPEKGRRKDLKKVDALIGKLQEIVESW